MIRLVSRGGMARRGEERRERELWHLVCNLSYAAGQEREKYSSNNENEKGLEVEKVHFKEISLA